MSRPWTPPRVAREEIAATEKWNATIRAVTRRMMDVTSYWTRRLRDELHDDRLEVVFAGPEVNPEDGLIPGRYHVLRYNEPPAPMSVHPVEKDGAFVEPGAWLVEELRAADLQNPQAVRAAEERKRKAEAAKQRAHEREAEDRRSELDDRWNAASRTFVSLDKSAPWTQNVNGKKHRPKEA